MQVKVTSIIQEAHVFVTYSFHFTLYPFANVFVYFILIYFIRSI